MSKKIFILTSDLYRGGVAESSRKLIKLLAYDESIEVFCLVYDKLPIEKELPKNITLINLNCHLVAEYHNKNSSMSFNVKRLLGVGKAFLKVIYYRLKYKPDVVYSLMYLPNILNVLTSFAGGDTIISERQNPKYDLKTKPRIIKDIFAFFYRKAKKVHVNSKELSVELCDVYRLRQKQFIYFPNFFLAKEYPEKKYKKKHQKLKVLIIGRESKQKGFEFLPDILKYLEGSVELSIVSNMKNDKLLDAIYFSAGTKHTVNILEEIPNIDTYYLNHDVLLVTSLWESFCNVIVEGMLYGMPIISNKCPTGPIEILEEGRWGFMSKVSLVEERAIAANEIASFIDICANSNEKEFQELSSKSLERSELYKDTYQESAIKQLLFKD